MGGKIEGALCVNVLFDDLRLVDFSTDDFQLLGKVLAEKKAKVVIHQLKSKGGDLCYFESGDGECDFVRRDGNECEAVQVCWEIDDDNRKREFDGLVGALKRFGLKSGTIVTANQSDEAVYRGCKIKILPLVSLKFDV